MSAIPGKSTSVLDDLPNSEPAIGDVADNVIASVPPPLELGDLASLGLISWTPAGLIRWSLELLNVSTGLPWFHSIVLGTLFWRILLVPLSIQTLRNTARLLPIQPRIVEVQAEMQRVKASGDKLALQRVALKMAKMYKDAGVSFGATMLSPFVQIPVTFGLFFGIRKMCALPVAQLTNSGVSFLPDLTVADPYMILPLAVCAVVNLQISVGVVGSIYISFPL
jgi:Preprotein translocase subunit YidC